MHRSVLIVGAGSGLSSSLALQCTNLGMDVALAARNIEKLEDLGTQTRASLHKCDASKIEDVNRLFKELDEKLGTPELVVYNPSARLRGAIEDLDPEKTLNMVKDSGLRGRGGAAFSTGVKWSFLANNPSKEKYYILENEISILGYIKKIKKVDPIIKTKSKKNFLAILKNKPRKLILVEKDSSFCNLIEFRMSLDSLSRFLFFCWAT